jgi:hypothetical protein
MAMGASPRKCAAANEDWDLAASLESSRRAKIALRAREAAERAALAQAQIARHFAEIQSIAAEVTIPESDDEEL